MDTARIQSTREIIDAETLWLMAVIDKDDFECHGCGAQVWPASFLRDINKRRPYFSLRTSEHIEPCHVHGEPAFLAKAKRQGIAGQESGFPLPYPNRLVPKPIQAVASSDAQPSSRIAHSRRAAVPARQDKSRRYHGHTVHTLRPICRRFMQLQFDHDNLSLHIPNCSGATFAQVFWQLTSERIFSSPTHLYFAPVRWNAPVVTHDAIEFLLDAGGWDQITRRRINPYRLRVDWATWTHTQRQALREELDVAIAAAKNQAKLGNHTYKAWLFFVGTQDADNPAVLTCKEHTLICCLEGFILPLSSRQASRHLPAPHNPARP
jgi:hypothetical protein